MVTFYPWLTVLLTILIAVFGLKAVQSVESMRSEKSKTGPAIDSKLMCRYFETKKFMEVIMKMSVVTAILVAAIVPSIASAEPVRPAALPVVGVAAAADAAPVGVAKVAKHGHTLPIAGGIGAVAVGAGIAAASGGSSSPK